KSLGSTTGRMPVTRSAVSLPAPRPMPKPWPEKPVAMKKPGSASTGAYTTTYSAVNFNGFEPLKAIYI
ncbi:hypothetical protein, partial [Rhodopila sp.]|uniref:hypothetical protein n=1 Tax=Rhodopila sp. TaxID=2480087 RepID=UPI002C631832|nr:hypothetical protein [Rhodopila sp.]